MVVSSRTAGAGIVTGAALAPVAVWTRSASTTNPKPAGSEPVRRVLGDCVIRSASLEGGDRNRSADRGAQDTEPTLRLPIVSA